MRAKTKKPQPVVSTNPSPTSFWNNPWFWGPVLFFLTLLLYWPSYRAGYIWDDNLMVGNALIHGGWPSLRDIWITTKFPDFCPMTATSFWLESQFIGTASTIRHATNIVLQAFNVVLLGLVLRRLKVPGAWLTAAIFAAHPLCVTSVTWVAERKNVLSMFFYLLSFLTFLKSQPTNARAGATESRITSDESRLYWLSFVFFIFALLSKSSVVILPVVFLLCAWWPKGRIERADLRRVLPFFIFAFAAGLATLIGHSFFGPKNLLADNLWIRLIASTWAIWFYVGKALLPMNLTMHYPRWEIDPASPLSYLPALALIGIFFACWRFRRSWGKACLFGLGYFILALGPTLGVAKMSFLKFSQVADHFQFLALPGLIAVVVGGVFYLTQPKRALHFCTVVLLVLLAIPLAAMSWKHQRIIGDTETLWSDNLKKNPKSWLAHNCVAAPLQARGQFKEAEAHYRKAIEMRPDYLDALSNLGVLLGRMERWDEAIESYRRAVAFNPNVAGIQFNLGTALFSKGKFAEAIVPLSKAVELDPANSSYRNNLASAFLQSGKGEEAFAHLREAIRLDPINAEALANFGLILDRKGNFKEAAVYHASANFLRGRESLNRNNVAEARAHFLKALEADGAATIEFAGRICTLSAPNSLANLDLLAATCAEAKRFADTTNALQKVIAFGKASGRADAVVESQRRLEHFSRLVAEP